jgi:hypothetical protein
MAKFPFQFSASPKFLAQKIPDTVTAQGLRLLLGICDYHNHRYLSTPPIHNQKLMDRTGLSARGVLRGRQQLIEAGIITAHQQDDNRKSPRWSYRFTEQILGVELVEEGIEKAEKDSDEDVTLNTKLVRSIEIPDWLKGEAKVPSKPVAVGVSEPKKEAEKSDIRINSKELSIKRDFEEQKSSESDSPKPIAEASVLAVGNKSVELVGKMIELAKSKLAGGEVDLNDWKPLALEAISPNTEGAKLLLVSYNQELVKDEYFKRVVKELR